MSLHCTCRISPRRPSKHRSSPEPRAWRSSAFLPRKSTRYSWTVPPPSPPGLGVDRVSGCPSRVSCTSAKRPFDQRRSTCSLRGSAGGSDRWSGAGNSRRIERESRRRLRRGIAGFGSGSSAASSAGTRLAPMRLNKEDDGEMLKTLFLVKSSWAKMMLIIIVVIVHIPPSSPPKKPNILYCWREKEVDAFSGNISCQKHSFDRTGSVIKRTSTEVILSPWS